MMIRILLPLAAVAVIAACGGETEDTAVTADAPAAVVETTPAPASGGAVTDPQIAAIVVAANEVDIEAGELAQDKTTNPQVTRFAQRMITDHSGVNQAATELVTRLGVTPEPSPTSEQLRQGGEQNRSHLQGLSGAEFDRAYIGHEVMYHQQVLDAIDQTLLSNANTAELRALLEQTRPAIEAHLQHAIEIQSSLGGS